MSDSKTILKLIQLQGAHVELRQCKSTWCTNVYIEVPSEHNGTMVTKLSSIELEIGQAHDIYNALKLILDIK